ncbi:hypothetical protein [Polaromonas aquatica]|uniref:hypothetical protein n=1 Tax=Polaromonas aquatica TaxID=332657 RepID=UPI003D654B9D
MKTLIQTSAKVHKTTYLKTFEVPYDKLSEKTAAWLAPAFEALAEKASLRPIGKTKWNLISAGILLLDSNVWWGAICDAPVKALSLEKMIRFFSEMEQQLSEVYAEKPQVASRTSSELRKFLKAYFSEHSDDQRLKNKSSYRTVLPIVIGGRQLISDLTSVSEHQENSLPIGAIEHTDAVDLKNQTREKMRRDVDEIKRVCMDVLTRYLASCESLRTCRQRIIDTEVEEALRAKIRHLSNHKLQANFTEAEKIDLITLYLRIDSNLRPPIELGRGGYPYCKAIADNFLERIALKKTTFRAAMRIEISPPVEVLVACTLLIQIHTAWNISSVLDLNNRDIRSTVAPYEIQSRKWKVLEETPVSFVEKVDVEIALAISVLKGRLEALKARGWVNSNEDSLWLSCGDTRRKKLKPIVGWSAALRKFQEQYKLAHFSHEEVRNQMLGLESLEKGSVFAAMHSAGHKSIATTGGYIDKILLQRVNSAVNLEFQRRWETSITYEFSNSAARLKRVPIGDGSSCADMKAPPKADWMEFGICTAKRCHSEGGCSNRQIVIDLLRIEEVAKTKRYFEKNWERLLNANPQAFEAYQLPAMLFNIGLFGALKNGPYRHLLKESE